ncbi:MAG: cell surface protein SprA, partial [Bacteroidales bacterium]|nr:cell surface protein SprA [Bacteroidales bacterium]
FLNWVNLSTRYNATFGWDVGPIIKDPAINLGNTIRNSNTVQLNGQINMINLYNKIPYLKALEQTSRQTNSRQQQEPARTREVTYERTGQILRVDFPRSYTHKLKTEKIKVDIFDGDGQKVEAQVEIIHENRIKVTPERDVRGARVVITGTRDLGESPVTFIVNNSLRILTGVKNLNLTYSNSEGSLLPGYLPETRYMGTDNYNGILSPGLGYIFGFQDDNFPFAAFNNGWLSRDSLLNTPYMSNGSEKINARATFEPFKGLRVDLTANRSKSESLSEFFIADKDGNLPDAESRGKTMTGNFSMSYLSWGTAFERINTKDRDFASDAFDKFKNEHRIRISERLANEYMEENPGTVLEKTPSGYYEGFGPTSQQVLISSFLSAYGGKDPERVSTQFFPSILEMMPNWRVTFDGLSRIDFVKRYLNSLTINHAYRSSYNIGSFISNPYELHFLLDPSTGNIIPAVDASSVSINEQFSPLFDLNMDWKNSLTSRIEFKRSRTLALSTSNSQINEVNSKEVVIGGGYRFNQVQIIINGREYRSDLNVRADLSIRDNRTVIRKLMEDTDQITAGQRIITIKTTFDYVLSDRFNLRFFYDQRINRPFVSLSYPTSNINVGFSVRFTLTN